MKSLNEVSRTPPRGGVRKKNGVRTERGVHAPRAPPLYTLLIVNNIKYLCLEQCAPNLVL